MKRWLVERIEGAERITRIRAEASSRGFFRLEFKNETRVAMLYPGPEPEALERIKTLTDIYLAHDIPVPRIHAALEDRALLQQDLGDRRLQVVFTRGRMAERRFWLSRVADILEKLAGIPVDATTSMLDPDRMHWEMDFFIQHFASRLMVPAASRRLQARLVGLVEAIDAAPVFAHRDFHCRNMMVHDGGLALVDFQDSMRAPRAYDPVSFAWDAYMDLGRLRKPFLADLEERGLLPGMDQVYLTALQRNLKALGTFGFQVHTRGHKSYTRYVARTLRHVAANPLAREMLEDSLPKLIREAVGKLES
jgi:aminoglycoside/choline kinase family phosphotransferase